MDPVKEAFGKIKSEINELRSEILNLKETIDSLQTNINSDIPTYNPTNPTNPTQNYSISNINSDIPTYNPTNPTQNYAIKELYTSNFSSSIGNDGVPTNQQTNKPTNQQVQNYSISNINSDIPTYNPTNPTQNYAIENKFNPQTLSINNDFKEANNILESLDNIKKGIRLKFKRLTTQEMLVFSHLYALEDQNYDEITYRTIAKKMSLSESSIRDYVNKLIKKGIPIEKIRQNNKIIVLKISEDLKNIANLATIQSLRSL